MRRSSAPPQRGRAQRLKTDPASRRRRAGELFEGARVDGLHAAAVGLTGDGARRQGAERLQSAGIPPRATDVKSKDQACAVNDERRVRVGIDDGCLPCASLQPLTFGILLGEFDLGDGDEQFGASLEIRRLEQGLFLCRAVRRHHRQRIDQGFVRRLVDAFPVGLQLVCLHEGAQRRENRLAVDRSFAFARDKIVDERRVGDAALPVFRFYRQFIFDAETRDAGELDQIAAVAALGELRDAAEAADFEKRRLLGGSGTLSQV